MQFGLVLDREGGKVRIRCEIAGGPCGLEEIEKDVRVTVSGMNENCLRPVEPGPDAPAGAAYVKRIVEYLRMRRYSDETKDCHPGEADAVRTVQKHFPPLPRRDVLPELGIVGMQKQVHVGYDHRSSRWAVSSASSSSAS